MPTTPTQSVVATMASAADPYRHQQMVNLDIGARLEAIRRGLTPTAMVSIPILEHIELSLATAPLLPSESASLKRTPCWFTGEARPEESWRMSRRRCKGRRQHDGNDGGPVQVRIS